MISREPIGVREKTAASRSSVIAIFILILLNFGVASGGCQDDHSLLEFLILQNEASRERIVSAEYEARFQLRLTEFQSQPDWDQEGTARILMDGNRLSVVNQYSHREGNASEAQEILETFVLNDEYAGHWPIEGNPVVYQYRHDSSGALSAKAREVRALTLGNDILKYGYGDGEATLREHLNSSPPEMFDWRIDQVSSPDGGTVYHVERRAPKDHPLGGMRNLWEVDPQKGYLITYVALYGKSGEVLDERKIKVENLGGEEPIWFPTEVEYNRYIWDLKDKRSESPVLSKVMQLSDVSVNGEIPNDRFDLEALGYAKESTRVFSYAADGFRTTMVYVDGILVPKQVLEDLDRIEARSFRDISERISTTDQLAGTSEVAPSQSNRSAENPSSTMEGGRSRSRRSLRWIALGFIGMSIGIGAWSLVEYSRARKGHKRA